jgi:hypothetical protein
MLTIETPPVVLLGQLADASGVPLWKLRRWFDAGKLGVQRPMRVGGIRAVPAEERDAVLATIRRIAGQK